MTRKSSMFIGLFLLLLTPTLAQDTATVKLPDTAAARLLEAYVKAFNTGKSAAVREFHAKYDARPDRDHHPDDRPVATGEDKMQGLISMLGELKIHRVLESKPNEIHALIKSSKGEWLSLWCQAQASSPDKLVGFRLEPTAAPVNDKNK